MTRRQSGRYFTVRRVLYLFSLVAGLAFYAPAQVQDEGPVLGSVMGSVDTGGSPANSLTVLLSAPGEPDRRVDLRSTGDFDFRDVPLGDYELKVTTFQGDVLHSEHVFVSAAERIFVRLSPPSVERAAPGGAATVSGARLQHNPPAKARKEFSRAAKASRENDPVAAVAHLTKAVTLDPEYMEAHYDLGVQYLRTHATN